jgi:hypothetical protein
LTCIPALIRNSCCAISTEIHIHISNIEILLAGKIQLFEFFDTFFRFSFLIYSGPLVAVGQPESTSKDVNV